MKINPLLIIGLLGFYSLPIYAENQSITIVNHFNKPLKVIVGLNPEVLPDMPTVLAPNQSATVTIVDMQKEAYVRAEDDQKQFAYFGMQVTDNTAKVSGYLSKGVAYSWNTYRFAFCTPDEYREHKGCIL